MTKSRGAYLENILEKNAASWYLYVNNGAAPISEILGAVRNEINNLYLVTEFYICIFNLRKIYRYSCFPN